MTTAPAEGDPAFADLLDELLDALLNGGEPDLADVALRHAGVAHRVEEAWQLACSVAGRRETRRPSLRGYRILRELGRGGMGTVYLARQEQLDREVALKVLPHSFGLSAHSRQRFLEEAKALARVHHEHIVGIHRIVDDGDLLAFEMEYVDGPSLQTVLTHLREVRDRDGKQPTLEHVAALLQLPTAELDANNLTQFFVRIARQIALALGAVHHAGFVHRDVKPANVLLRKNGRSVLADFGLVRDTDLERTHKTGFAGTPVYSSPEQLRGNTRVGPTADVYALAVTLYECLTLTVPFAGRTTTDMLSRIDSGRVPPLRRHAPHAPRDLETIVAHAMELEPERRYADGDAFAEDLQRLLELQPILARPPGLARRVAKFLRRHHRPLLAGCLGAVIVAAFLLPMLSEAYAAERDAAAARDHVRAARQALLSPECRNPAWHAMNWTGAAPAEAAEHRRAIATLQRAIDEYGTAIALRPDSTSARRELAVARMLLWLRQLAVLHADSLAQAMAEPGYQAIAAELPPPVRAVAEASAADRIQDLDRSKLLAQCSERDRHSLGLLAFLVGERKWCEAAWADLPTSPEDQALRDAGLGLLYLADEAPERAYVRLQAAQRELPAAMLALELADAALAMGETDLARRWLAEAPDEPNRRTTRSRIEADLLVATGDQATASSIYLQLAEQNPLDPTARHRLARLSIRDGDLSDAAKELDALLVQWPSMTQLRLDRARVALQQRDVAAYLHEVLATLHSDPETPRAADSNADQLEILRIGGLSELHRQASRTGYDLRCGRAFLGGEIPLRGMLPPLLVDDLERLLPGLAELQALIRGFQTDSGLSGPAAWALIAAPLAMSRLPALANLLTPLQRTCSEALPWCINRFYPPLHADLRTLFISLLPTDWHLLHLRGVPTPKDLDPAHLFGTSMARGADWNGDGEEEILVGCESPDPRQATGRVYLVDGRSAQILAVITSNQRTNLFGHSVALVGDVDGDTVPDWIVGAPSGTKETRHGFVELYSGRTRQCIAHIEGEGAAFGVDVCGLGDCDGDGCPDFAVGTPPIVRNSSGQGSAAIFSGRTRQPLHQLDNDVAGIWFGACLADAGDTDGDGVHDLVVGGNFGDAPGLVQMFSGRTGVVLQAWRDESKSSGFGMAIAGPGDLDGDGYGDVTISAIRLDESNGLDQVHVYSGHTGARFATLTGRQPGARFGTSVARFDQNHGRNPLLAIGASMGGTGACGAVELWPVDGTQVTTLQGPAAFSGFGGVVVSARDLDGDGRSELFVSCPIDKRAGAVYRIDSKGIPFPR
jgi:tRNA A-37 threonylcarbamoyl transferase component Bud32